MDNLQFNSDLCSLQDNNNTLVSNYKYDNVSVDNTGRLKVHSTDYQFKTDLNVAKCGVLLVGLGGNNGSTVLSSITALRNNINFHNKRGQVDCSLLYGSMTQCSTVKLGIDAKGNDYYTPFNKILPMLNPTQIVVSGWDINNANLFDSIKRAGVLEFDLQQNLKTHLIDIIPMPSIYYPDFIASNQSDRANNLINLDSNGNLTTKNKWEHLITIRDDIRNFKNENSLDKVIILWTANTERYVDIIPGINDTPDNILKAIKIDHNEISPSNIFAIASILEGCPYINGSPQNTFVPGIIKLAERENVLIAGDDLKTGQTKLKSVLMQFLVDAGIKPLSIASYNHLGNNDGKNLSSERQFKSKEISKSSVIDDCIDSNKILFPSPETNRTKYNNDNSKDDVDHCIVIKYIPAVGDDKVAMDEYYSQLMLGGHNRISIHNVCEDSLLATPIIIDLIVMTEFLSRIKFKILKDNDNHHNNTNNANTNTNNTNNINFNGLNSPDSTGSMEVDNEFVNIDNNNFNINNELNHFNNRNNNDFQNLYPILSFLSYWLKAPLTRSSFKPINSLNRQRLALENLLKILIGLPTNNELRLEEKF